VVVVDEAALVSSADLGRVVTLAAEAEAKVVLVGDHRQLGAVEAGGLFRLLAGETEAAELSGVRRFHAEWEREASLGLRDGDRAVVEEYYQHGGVVGGERGVMVDEAFERWQCARARGDSVVVCAADQASVEELAARARAARAAAGEVEAEGVVAGKHVVGVGDEIVTTRNDRRLVTSGAVGPATAIAGRCSPATATTPWWCRTRAAGDGWCSPGTTSMTRWPWPTR
jgi:hypothetical protein